MKYLKFDPPSPQELDTFFKKIENKEHPFYPIYREYARKLTSFMSGLNIEMHGVLKTDLIGLHLWLDDGKPPRKPIIYGGILENYLRQKTLGGLRKSIGIRSAFQPKNSLSIFSIPKGASIDACIGIPSVQIPKLAVSSETIKEGLPKTTERENVDITDINDTEFLFDNAKDIQRVKENLEESVFASDIQLYIGAASVFHVVDLGKVHDKKFVQKHSYEQLKKKKAKPDILEKLEKLLDNRARKDADSNNTDKISAIKADLMKTSKFYFDPKVVFPKENALSKEECHLVVSEKTDETEIDISSLLKEKELIDDPVYKKIKAVLKNEDIFRTNAGPGFHFYKRKLVDSQVLLQKDRSK